MGTIGKMRIINSFFVNQIATDSSKSLGISIPSVSLYKIDGTRDWDGAYLVPSGIALNRIAFLGEVWKTGTM